MESIHSISKPVVFIIGPTGSGKSDLAEKIASAHNGQIINADAFQIYSNSAIMTAAPSNLHIPTHLYQCLPMDASLNIQQYTALAIPAIKKVLDSNALPIIVGGTHYYIENLIFLKSSDSVKSHIEITNPAHAIMIEAKDSANKYDVMRKCNTEQLYKLLMEIDPDIVIHSHDRRRIENALLTYYMTDTKESCRRSEACILRYPNAILINCALPEMLKEEVYVKRIQKMLKV